MLPDLFIRMIILWNPALPTIKRVKLFKISLILFLYPNLPKNTGCNFYS